MVASTGDPALTRNITRLHKTYTVLRRHTLESDTALSPASSFCRSLPLAHSTNDVKRECELRFSMVQAKLYPTLAS